MVAEHNSSISGKSEPLRVFEILVSLILAAAAWCLSTCAFLIWTFVNFPNVLIKKYIFNSFKPKVLIAAYCYQKCLNGHVNFLKHMKKSFTSLTKKLLKNILLCNCLKWKLFVPISAKNAGNKNIREIGHHYPQV